MAGRLQLLGSGIGMTNAFSPWYRQEGLGPFPIKILIYEQYAEDSTLMNRTFWNRTTTNRRVRGQKSSQDRHGPSFDTNALVAAKLVLRRTHYRVTKSKQERMIFLRIEIKWQNNI